MPIANMLDVPVREFNWNNQLVNIPLHRIGEELVSDHVRAFTLLNHFARHGTALTIRIGPNDGNYTVSDGVFASGEFFQLSEAVLDYAVRRFESN